jgi:hypothetical protein
MVSSDLAAKILRGKCISEDGLKMIGHLEDLMEMWNARNTCSERPEKYRAEALKLIFEFRRYKVFDSAGVREFYLLLRATIKSGTESLQGHP